jgi:hypothetical protein
MTACLPSLIWAPYHPARGRSARKRGSGRSN